MVVAAVAGVAAAAARRISRAAAAAARAARARVVAAGRLQGSARRSGARPSSARPSRTVLPEACVLPSCAQPPRMALSRARRLVRAGGVCGCLGLAFLSWALINASRYKALQPSLLAYCPLHPQECGFFVLPHGAAYWKAPEDHQSAIATTCYKSG